VTALRPLRVTDAAEGRAANKSAADGREAAAGGLPVAVRVAQLRRGDAAAGMRFGERGQRGDPARLDLDVGVRGDHERGARGRDAAVDVGAEAQCALVLDHRRAAGRWRAAGVDREHELVDLGCEGVQTGDGIWIPRRPDHDCGDAQSSAR
jgi:hypothetical protein